MLTENIMYLNLPNNPDKVKLFADQIYVTQVSQELSPLVTGHIKKRQINLIPNFETEAVLPPLKYRISHLPHHPRWQPL